jgi:outer membrane receptor protein involved in Fe transport
MPRFLPHFLFLCALILPGAASQAQDKPVPNQELIPQQNVVDDYAATYFNRYRPNTALDMVRLLPGFQLDDGDEIRGFASAIGNVLINDKYTSAKQDLPSAILSRIPASQVERIELIRGQIREIDLQGRALVANIILRKNVPGAVRWDTFLEHNNAAPLKPGISISLSDLWDGIDYNVGISIERDSSGRYGKENFFDSSGRLTEARVEDTREDGHKVGGIFLNASSLIGETRVNVNTKLSMYDSAREHTAVRLPAPVSSPVETITVLDENRNVQIEIGADAERGLLPDLTGKAIFLFFHQKQDPLSTQSNFDVSGKLLQLRQATGNNDTTEGIGRLEFDWGGMSNHAVQLNLEVAYNSLDGSLVQLVGLGSGQVEVDVPGANTRVEELRGDFVLKDTWTFDQIELDYGFGAETSSISQTGDTDLERDFFFVKPHIILSYSPTQGQQTRIRLAREVAQLDFTDFISATLYEDNDLALGNPNLQPDTTWVAELGHERRFGESSVIKATLFHHWIKDVLDLLPLSETFEAPGNIGDGRRWGVELENTLPLDWLGLTGARLDLKLRWQDSSVIDPLSGLKRVLSGEGGDGGYRTLANLGINLKYYFNIDFRQDFESDRFAWGWTLAERDRRILYKVNEFESNDENFAMNTFIETTRWFDMKIRLAAENIFNYTILRDRTVYAGMRDSSSIDYFSSRQRHLGRRLILSLSGNF